jgi:hypothetical protein
MNTTLLMPDQDMFQFIIVIIQCIINRHDGTAGITEKFITPSQINASNTACEPDKEEFSLVAFLQFFLS